MPFKKKVEYIWEYYKFPIIGVIAAIIFIFTFVRDWRLNHRPIFLNALVINSDIAYLGDNYIKDDYIKFAGVDTDAYNLYVDTSITITEGSYDQMTTANIQKVMALFSAGELDCVLGPESIMNDYASMGAFMDLTEILTEDKIKALEDAGCEMYYATEYEEDENGNRINEKSYLAGVYLDKCKYFSTEGHNAFEGQMREDKRPVFCPVATSVRTDNSMQLLNMLTGI